MLDPKYILTREQIEALSEEETEDFYNGWATYWRYDVGINVMPGAWRIVNVEKEFIPIMPWKQFQNKPIPEKLFQEWIHNGAFSTGIAGIFGPVWHRPDRKGYYFGQIDADNALAIREIIGWKGDTDIAAFAKKTLVEQHADNRDQSAHFNFYWRFLPKNKDSDVPRSDELRPSFELHCLGHMGIMAGSKHRKGYPMMVLSHGAKDIATEPLTLEDDHLDQYLNSVCIRYGLTAYLSNSSNEPSKRNGGKNNDRTEVGDDQKRSDGIPLIDDLAEMLKKGPSYYDEKIEITDGIRHNTILKIADSILFRYSDDHDLRVLKDWFILINEHCCRPQLGTSERNKIWNDAVEYVGKQKALESQRILTVSEAVREGHGSNKTVRGTIFSVSTLFKVATSLYYKCMSCGTINNGFIGITIYFGHENNNNHSSSSGRCVNCAERMLELDYKLSTFNDAKIVVLQNADLTADLDETLEVMLLGEHTKDVKAGEVVVIRGAIYYGASNLGKQSKTKKTITLMTAKFVTYEGRQNIDITESDIEAFHRFASLKNHGSNSNDDVIHRLVSMTAPNVIGEEPYKLGILRSIVGGSEGQRRGRIHTLSVGDKGLAKSLVMNEGLKMKPNARKITAQSASSTSALGIVDSTNDVKTLIYGPIPLSSGSMVGIDELQSWTFDNQGILLNVMEEGRFNLLKYARDKEIVAETTILATANPQDIKYEDRTSISVKEINLLAPLLDRFDQIYVSLDEIDEQKDWDYSERRMKYTRERRSHNYHFITNYLVYAQGIEPVLTPEASEMLRKFWIELRKQKLTGRRMLESIFRIAEATTKLRLKKVIDAELALEAQQSIQVMLVRLGQYVKTIKDPRDAALDEVIGVIENTQTKIAFDEAARLVEDENERVRVWLTGGSSRELNTGYNKKYRELRDRFLQRINQPDSKISVVKMVPLVVVWQTAKAPNIVIDQIDQIDQDQTFDDQKSVLTNGHKITESCDEEKNNDLATFTSTKNEISEVNSRSNRSIRSISSGEKPTYEYLKETDAYRCNWCKCIYLEDTKDTNAAHPCNFRGRA